VVERSGRVCLISRPQISRLEVAVVVDGAAEEIILSAEVGSITSQSIRQSWTCDNLWHR
jgi:hypothetical protein